MKYNQLLFKPTPILPQNKIEENDKKAMNWEEQKGMYRKGRRKNCEDFSGNCLSRSVRNHLLTKDTDPEDTKCVNAHYNAHTGNYALNGA